MTPTQNALLQRLLAVLGADRRVQAVWLSGSLGRGEGDAWSDVDLVAQVPAADLASCVKDYSGPGSGLPETVLSFVVHGVVVSSITPEWERFDIHFASAEQVARLDATGWSPLLGEGSPPGPAQAGETSGTARLRDLVVEFLRVLGLSPVMVGREEWLMGQQGVELLRKMLIDLMIEENGHGAAARGAKRLNAYLTPGQRAELEALAPPRCDRDALVRSHLEMARRFLPRARSLASARGVAWPDRFEEATRRHLEASLGVRF